MKIIKAFIIFIVLLTLTGCSFDDQYQLKISSSELIKPELTEIRSICNLATLECYYHNVAVYHKSAGTGWLNVFEVDRTFWIEYSGIVKVGIDLSALRICVDSNIVTVTLPAAKVISIKVDDTTINENSVIASVDNWLNRNPIEPEDQTAAIKMAQEDMLSTAQQNSSLLISAQTRAKELIEIYITEISELTGTPYEIIWIYE